MTTRIGHFSAGAGDINTWIVGDDEEVIVIDPGSDAAGLLDAVGDVRLEVIYAPGHTPGSVCLYCEDLGAVFTGHVMLAGGPARQDGEYPDFAGQLNAIGEYLLPLPAGTRVLPGQGPETTIAMAEKNFDSWVAAGPAPSGLGG